MPERALLTYEDLVAAPDDRMRREIINGELVVSPSPRVRHQLVGARLHHAIGDALAGAARDRVIWDVNLVLGEHDIVEPDIVYVAEDQKRIIEEVFVRGVPALVIEVLSDPRLDRVLKRDLYARYRVPEYWIADPDADRIEVYRLGRDGYGKPEIIEPGDTLMYQRIPGLAIDVAAIFARND